MPITNETIVEANSKMLGKTNRAVLFASVNLDQHLDPEVPSEDLEETPSLASMLAKINEVSEEEFLSEVQQKLTVTSFKDFLEKFQPGFYYRVRPIQVADLANEDVYEAGGEEVESQDTDRGETTNNAPSNGAEHANGSTPPPMQLEF